MVLYKVPIQSIICIINLHCSTDVEGKHINGQGNYGICGPECPSENDDDLVKIKNRLNDDAIVFDGNRSDQPS